MNKSSHQPVAPSPQEGGYNPVFPEANSGVLDYLPDKAGADEYMWRQTPMGQHAPELRFAHSQGYFDLGYVDREHETEEGFLDESVDPYASNSVYYAALADNAVKGLPYMAGERSIFATARKIVPDRDSEWDFFQMYRHAELYDGAREKLQLLDPTQAVEISGLVKWRREDTLHTFMLYAEMFSDSIERGENYWLMTLVNQSKTRLTSLLEPALTQLGPEVALPNTEVTTTPYMIDLRQGIVNLAVSAIRIKGELARDAEKAPEDRMPEEQAKKLKRLEAERTALVHVITKRTPGDIVDGGVDSIRPQSAAA